MAVTGAAVTVTDRIPYSAVVSPEQAVAYCRRALGSGWEYRRLPGAGVDKYSFTGRHGGFVAFPVSAEAEDWGRRMAELCDSLVSLGIASRPSDVLRAMSQEPPPGTNYCAACDKTGVITTKDGRHVKCGGPVVEGAEVEK